MSKNIANVSTGVEIVQVDNLMSRWHNGDIITHTGFSGKRLKMADILICSVRTHTGFRGNEMLVQ